MSTLWALVILLYVPGQDVPAVSLETIGYYYSESGCEAAGRELTWRFDLGSTALIAGKERLRHVCLAVDRPLGGMGPAELPDFED